MDRKRFKNRFIKMTNINEPYKLRFKTRYNFLGLKFTIKNKKKIEFYKKQKEAKCLEKYKTIIEEMNVLQSASKKNTPLITCCIVTYNHEQTIEKTITSILSQKTKYPFEIKIYDDCSTDKTVEICSEYAKKYPDKIKYILQPKNTSAIQASAFFRNLKSKYYTIIDGDDYWCNENKLEMGLDFLENNPEYTIWAHDTLFNNEITNNSYSYVHGHLGYKNVKERVTHDNFIYLHLSARIHRNIIDWSQEYEQNRKRDIFIYHATLDKGPLHYHDEIMSVYTFNKKGVFSKLSAEESKYSNKYSYYTINKYLNYRQDKYFTAAIGKELIPFKNFFGKKLGWFLYMKHLKKQVIKEIINKQKKKLNTIEKGHKLFDKADYAKLIKISKYQ